MRLGKLRYDSKFIAIKFFYETKNWSINWMCKQLEISRAAYYKWLHREIPKKEAENMKLAEFIKEYDERFNHILGYRRMTSWINHFNHTDYKPKRVHRIMKKLGIHSVIRKKKKKYTSSAPESIAENKLGRDFYACAPNEKWATDVTEFKVLDESKKLYLSVILDLYDRYPVAYVISPRNDNKLVFKTFDKALATNPEAKPLFHSDRGFQYTSKVFQKKLKEHEMEQSMSRVGRCIDNGPTEGFWGIINTEMYQMYEITNEESLRFAITDYIRFYSEERPHILYGRSSAPHFRYLTCLLDRGHIRSYQSSPMALILYSPQTS
ncbi:IS3 family transposase [Anthropogastromicrobium aceti]|uniref:IS3 family transposase n=1 Tax=Anthropogastromicrobium aceti TaxID=2981768 RepID=A0AAE3JDB4_9FIRM|nr:IS3 family transposase [Anthropogastromicrobium aceti]MCC2222488.1 IS3 family transposase [Anthropogastromicrobium aceti]